MAVICHTLILLSQIYVICYFFVIGMSEVTLKFDQYREVTEKKLLESRNIEEQLKQRIADLNFQLSKLCTGTSHSTAELNGQLTKTQQELTSAQSDLEQTRNDLIEAKSHLSELSASLQAAEGKYGHEVSFSSNI
jgi:peptidoglycan hydrolase CwlO-like protein